ncbi:hypothetical protein B0H16DRAFT_1696534 [Mycena metata]|uniref:Uncharacterized protein n=1 Tax=Mycena metata TaxID=1033252 RepID=A0AAD7I1I0_9AGAR|nr:hypothetical protein B0H16DRAFT_1696534 [Mycena metata]
MRRWSGATSRFASSPVVGYLKYGLEDAGVAEPEVAERMLGAYSQTVGLVSGRKEPHLHMKQARRYMTELEEPEIAEEFARAKFEHAARLDSGGGHTSEIRRERTFVSVLLQARLNELQRVESERVRRGQREGGRQANRESPVNLGNDDECHLVWLVLLLLAALSRRCDLGKTTSTRDSPETRYPWSRLLRMATTPAMLSANSIWEITLAQLSYPLDKLQLDDK